MSKECQNGLFARLAKFLEVKKPFILLVGAAGFEPTTSWSRTKRATKLRYAPIE